MTANPIPVWSYEEEYREHRDTILAACDRVFKSNRLIFGEEGKAFEAEMAAAHGMSGGVGVNSGTDALEIALRALGVAAGDEVITVPNTAVPTVSAIGATGAQPVFVDVRADDFLMDVAKLEAAITPNTKAVIPVHLYGQCVDMDPLLDIAKRRGLKVLEDVAQAQGAFYKGLPAGSMGDASAWSFYPTKVLGGYGDGGLILARDEAVLALARSLRFYGMEGTYYSERPGRNSRLDEVQAAILRTKLPLVAPWVKRRRHIASCYRAELGNAVCLPREAEYGRHAWYLFVAEHDDRDGMIKRLGERGILCNISYPWPIHLQRGYAYLGYRHGDFPVAEAKAKRIFSLPMYPYLYDEQIRRVIDAVKEVSNG
ncbi:MAG: DegT/DnrJ/EryC1/StrS family aminotransferase [Alphaproteobacteria bacterium]|nr:DegT/DnrJ/EryC1/StrS family aminotransferase [Alphaproteobacteria bacterium]